MDLYDSNAHPDAASSELGAAEALPASAIDASALLGEPSGWTDAITGTEGPRYWDRILSGEQARLRRFGRSVTIVLLELYGFEDAATRIGQEAALQKFAQLARALVAQVRASDHVARIGPRRFGLVLVETTELEALNYIDRILKRLQTTIADDGLAIRVGVGWASPKRGEQLSAAIATAEERLVTDFFHTL